MNNPTRLNRELIRGEVIAKIHWGAEVGEVLALLQTQHGIRGDEADAMIAEALAARAREIRKKALLRLIFASIGFTLSAIYFAIKSFTHTISIGGGSALLGSLAVISLVAAVRSIGELLSGNSSSRW